MNRWELENASKAWETSDVHLAVHRADRSKPVASYIIESRQELYHMLSQKSILIRQ